MAVTPENINDQENLNNSLTEEHEIGKAILEILRERAGISSTVLDTQQDINNSIKSQSKFAKRLNTEQRSLSSLTSKITKEIESVYSIQKDSLGLESTKNQLTEKRLSLTKQAQLLDQLQAKFLMSGVEGSDIQAQNIEEQLANIVRTRNELAIIESHSEEIQRSFGVGSFAAFNDIAKSIPGLRSYSTSFGEAAEASRQQAIYNKEAFGDIKGISSETAKKITLERRWEEKKRLYKEKRKEGMTSQEAASQAGEESIINIPDVKSLSPLMAGVKSLGANLMTALGPIALLGLLVSSIMEVDQVVGSMAKGMGVSYKEATGFHKELNEAAKASGENFVSSKDLSEMLTKMNDSLGTGVMLNKDMLVQMSALKDMAGFTNEEMIALGKISISSGKPVNDITKEFMAQAKIASLKNGVLLNEKELLKGIGKVSSSITLSLGQNPGLIAEAVATAKSLGMELDQVNSIADSLLNFQDSIQAEMSAELILGRNLNLEKARQYALDNNLAGVASEIAKQVETAAEFGNLNRIEQEALAKAVGMTKDQLADSLFIREQLKGATGEQAEKDAKILQSRIDILGQEGALAELQDKKLEGLREQASNSDKIRESTEKLKDVFTSMAIPLMDIINPIVSMLAPAIAGIGLLLTPITSAFKIIGGLIEGNLEGIKGWEATLGGVVLTLATLYGTMKATRNMSFAIETIEKRKLITEKLSLILGKSKLAQMVAQAVAYTIAHPVAALVGIGLAAGIGKIVYDKAGDVMSPSKGKTRVSTKEGGLFELSPNDDLIAAPNLLSNKTQQSQNTTSPAISLEKLYSKLDELIAAVKMEGDVYLDGNKVGKSLALNTSRMG